MMATKSIFACLEILCLLSSTITAQQYEFQFQERRHALVIGNTYSGSKELQFTAQQPRHDAENVEKVLKKLGFENISMHLDVSKSEMDSIFSTFVKHVRAVPGLAMVYFSGLDVSVNGHKFLVPHGIPEEEAAKLSQKPSGESFLDFLESNAFDCDKATQTMHEVDSAAIVVVEACSAWAVSKGEEFKPKGLYFVHSGALPKCNSKTKETSLFTAKFVQTLEDPKTSAGVNVHGLFSKVRDSVAIDTRRKQVPKLLDNLLFADKLYLRPRDPMVFCPENAVLPHTIPDENLHYGRHRQCLATFMALLASEASYKGAETDNFAKEAQTYLQQETRSFASRMQVSDETQGGKTDEAFLVIDEPFHRIRIIAFRGTDFFDYKDMLTDIKIWSEFFIEGRVHKGFHDRAINTRAVQAIKQGLREGKHVVVTGHSLGGAVAALVTVRMLVQEELSANEQDRLICITFGQPHVGNSAFATFISKSYNDHFFSYVHKNDVVPRLMPKMTAMKEERSKASSKGFLKRALDLALSFTPYGFLDRAFDFLLSFTPYAHFDEYEAFGTYLFLNDADLVTYNTADPTRRSELMEMMKSTGDIEVRVQLEHHRVHRYGAFMERVLHNATVVQGTRRPKKEL